VLTVPIDLTGITGSDQRQVPLNLPEGVTANVPTVRVTFTLTRFRETP
jgi:YbbR domain-containing protein